MNNSFVIPYQLDVMVEEKFHPQKSTPHSIGYDLFAQEDVLVPSYPKIMRNFIQTGEWSCHITGSSRIQYDSPIFVTYIPLNFHVDYPRQCYSILIARSSLSKKKGLILANSVGLIDTDFRDNHLASVINLSGEDVWVYKNEKIAQVVFKSQVGVELIRQESIDLSSSHKGFGGTGGYKEVKKDDGQLYLNFEKEGNSNE